MKGRVFLSLLCVFFSIPIFAQDPKTFREQYDAFKKQSMDSYSDFRGECNRRYSEFLRGAWEWFQIAPAFERPKEENVVPPVIYEEDNNEKEEETVIIEDVIEPDPQVVPQPQPVSPISPEPISEIKRKSIDYFGTKVSIATPESLVYLSDISGKALSDAWDKLSDGRYDQALYDCLQIRDQLVLCDWAYLCLLVHYASSCYEERYKNEVIFLTSFMYCQSGYDMRIAHSEKEELCMLYSSTHKIAGIPYLEIDGNTYYLLGNPEGERLATITESFEGSSPLSLWFPQAMKLENDLSEARVLKGTLFNSSISTRVNKNLISFYDCYPTSICGDDIMTRWAMYAEKQVDDNLIKGLYPQIRKALPQGSTANKLNYILNFVQTAFVYEFDDKVWGYDRAFFPEETLFYPYSDCEDRAILFSRMVKDILGLEVLLVYYPGHLATAVHLDEVVNGDCLVLDGRRYMICDPTYVGAPIGHTMPGMDNNAAQVIRLKK